MTAGAIDLHGADYFFFDDYFLSRVELRCCFVSRLCSVLPPETNPLLHRPSSLAKRYVVGIEYADPRLLN